jgi:hypothetical protein
VKKILELNITQ